MKWIWLQKWAHVEQVRAECHCTKAVASSPSSALHCIRSTVLLPNLTVRRVASSMSLLQDRSFTGRAAWWVVGGGWWVTGGRHPSSLFGNGDEWFTSPEAVVVLLLGKVPGAMPNCQSGTRLRSLEGIIFALSISPDPRPAPRPSPLAPAARQERPPAVQ